MRNHLHQGYHVQYKYCPADFTYKSRIRKRRRYVPQKIKSSRFRFFTAILGVSAPRQISSFTSSTTYHSHANRQPLPPEAFSFDSDSFRIGIDNHSSYSISNNIKHFSPPPAHCNATLVGINSRDPVPGIGTVHWTIDDDNGTPHTIHLPGTLYVPNAPICLLSPQHWSQHACDNYPTINGTWCATYAHSVILHWSQNLRQHTIPLHKDTNTPIMYSSGGSSKAQLALQTITSTLPACALEETVAYSSVTPVINVPHKRTYSHST